MPPIPLPYSRIGYDIPFNATYPTNPMYTPQPTPFPPPPHEIYSPTPPNVVLTPNGATYYPPQSDYKPTVNQNLDMTKQPHNWESVVGDKLKKCSNFRLIYVFFQIQKNPNVSIIPKNAMSVNRSTSKSLTELIQLKLDVITQLEKVVGKNAASEISTMASNMARQEQVQDLDSPSSPCSWQIPSGPTFVRSDSILTADDDYVPYDSPAISKYGPISRMPKDNGLSQSLQASFREPSLSSSMVF